VSGTNFAVIIRANQLAHLAVPDGVRLVSLDLFDTLLIRNVDPPEVAIRLVAGRIAAQNLLPLTAEDYLVMRGRIEAELNAEAGESGNDPECSILEIAQRMTALLRLPAETANTLVDIELEVEALLLDPSPEVVSFIRCLSSRCRIIAISDTYFNSEQLARLLESLGLAHCFSRVYASCDHRMTKRSGRIFDFVLAQERLKPAEMMHIGDNFHGDYLSARKIGIHAACLFDEETLVGKQSLRRALATGEPADLYRLYFARIRGGAGDFHGFGREVMGPLLTLFTAKLLERLADSDCRSVFFLARDSFLLKKLYQQMAPSGEDRELSYIGISRYTAALASIRSLGAREVKLAGFACTCLRDAMHRLGVGAVPDMDAVAARHGLEPDKILKQEQLYQDLAMLFADSTFSSCVLRAASVMREKLETYLEQKGFFSPHRPTALVDIGWHGTIQECLVAAFGDRPDFPLLTGYYVALMPPVLENSTARKGLILDYRRATAEESVISLYQEIWELSTRGFHGTTVGYTEFSGHMLPVWRRGEPGGKKGDIYRFVLEIQRGILDCARDFRRMDALLPAELTSLQDVAVSRYDLAMSFPDLRYVELFERCSHSDDFGLERMTPLVRRFAWRELFALRHFLGEFLANPWREASLVSSRMPLLSLYHAAKKFICWQRAARHYSS